jgi:hypothetical protein
MIKKMTDGTQTHTELLRRGLPGNAAAAIGRRK